MGASTPIRDENVVKGIVGVCRVEGLGTVLNGIGVCGLKYIYLGFEVSFEIKTLFTFEKVKRNLMKV